MYLKKLTVQGFKSFANRTSFEFGPGITAVVGPNGSGKSNVADAIRWVLGEQSSKLLRARKQEDVIFAGGAQRSPVGMAEVLLTLDNSDAWLPLDFSEIEIGRRLYRNGDSEYLLNGSRVRLRDLTELLARGEVGQNSYTIMGQGLVDEVLLMSPDDRRGFVDEAADVRRYRVRIREAQDRLAATRDNLDRVSLIIREIQPRLSQLRRQAERAAQQAELTHELADLLKAYYGQAWAETQNSLARARAALDQRAAENIAASDRVSALRDQLRTLGEEIRKRREAIARLQSRNTELDERLATTERAIALDRERHAMTVARHAELQVELETMEDERRSLSTSDLDDGRRGAEVAELVASAQAQVGAARDGLDDAERAFGTVRAEVQELRSASEADVRRLRDLEGEARAANRRLEELDREETVVEGRRRTLLAQVAEYAKRYATARAALRGTDGNIDAARMTAEQARERLAALEEQARTLTASTETDRRELDHLEGRLDALRHIEAENQGVAVGTRTALALGGALEPGTAAEVPGILGLLSRHIRVPGGLEAAINAALDHRLHAVIVEREDQALSALALLQERRGGRAMMLPLDGVRHVYPLNLSNERGVVGVAARLVRCDDRVRPLVDTLLGRIIIVEDLQVGLRMVKRGLGAVVTIDGTFIEPNGVISGGATGAEEGPFLRQRELEELPETIAALRQRTAGSDSRLADARRAVAEAAREARQATADYESLLRRAGEARTGFERERDRLHRLRREMTAILGKRADIARERGSRTAAIAGAQAASGALTRGSEERRAALASGEATLQAATAQREAALRAYTEASSALATAEGERRALHALREQHERTLQRLAEQVAARREQILALERESAAIEARLTAASEAHAALAEEREHQVDDAAPERDELSRLESHERQVNDDLAEAQADLLRLERLRLDLEAEVSRLAEHLETLRTELAREGLAPDRTGRIVPIEQATAEVGGWTLQGGTTLDMGAARTRIEDIRRQLRRLGPVNEEAPEDFRELEDRHEFLTSQVQDLTTAEEQLLGVIAELNEEIRARFGVAFERVDAAFREYFSAFFGGGSARLVLTDPDNLAETGIDIEAQPPGKKVKSLTLLSGGERSLTAVALLFALLTVNPAPFCVLDEVDAALDEANVTRFTGALAELAHRTQFVVVTHNRRTIEQGNAIYGVSMARNGISRVLSVRLDQISEDGEVETSRPG